MHSISTETALGYSAEELNAMGESQRKEVIQEYLEKFEDVEEREEALEALEDELDKIKRAFEQQADNLEDIQDGVAAEDAGKHADLLAEVNSVIATLDEMTDDMLEDVNDDIAEHNQDHTNGSDATLGDIDLNGSTYTYTMSNTGGNRFKDDLTDEEWLIEEEITNEKGEVIRDYNGDGKKNYDDITAALKDRINPLDQQAFYINGDYVVTLVEHSSDNGGTMTLRLEDADGNVAYVVVENSNNVSFYFNDRNLPSNDVLLGYPRPVLGQWRIQDDDTPIEDHLFETDVSDEIRNSAIEGYEDLIDGLSSNSVIQYTDGNLNGNQQSAVTEAIDLLYSYLDDPSKNLNDIWNDIMTSFGRFSREEQQLMFQYLIINMWQNSTENFSTFFSSAVSRIEDVVTEGATANMITAILLLETQTEYGGNYNGAEVMTTAFSTDGKNKGTLEDTEANVEALKNFKKLVSNNGGNLTGNEDSAIAYEEDLLTTGREGLSGDLGDGETGFDKGFEYFLTLVGTYNKDVTENEMTLFIKALRELINNGESPLGALTLLIENPGDYKWEKEDSDDLINNFVKMLQNASNSSDPTLMEFADFFLSRGAVVDFMIETIERDTKKIADKEKDSYNFLLNL